MTTPTPPSTYAEAFDQGLADAIMGAPRRWPRVRNRASALGGRLGYDDGYHDGQGRLGSAPVVVAHLRLSGPDDPVHWTCPNCGQGCTCTLPGLAHLACGMAPEPDPVM